MNLKKKIDWLLMLRDISKNVTFFLFGIMIMFCWVGALHYFAITSDLPIVAKEMLKWWGWMAVAWIIYVITVIIQYIREKRQPLKKKLNDWFDEFVLDDCRFEAKKALKEILEVK